MTETVDKSVILAVDDTPENLDVVKGALGTDYIIRAAINGRIALKIAEKQLPDLILLDIMMPEMDGYEVCQKLKANTRTADIPQHRRYQLTDGKIPSSYETADGHRRLCRSGSPG